MAQKQVNIIGSGSMGHLWAGYLYKNNIQVTLFSRRPTPAQNMTVKAHSSSFEFQTKYKIWPEWTKPDFIIVCVKANNLDEVCLKLSRLTQPLPPIILMMNGMGLIETVSKYLPNAEVFQAATTHGAILEKSSQEKVFSKVLHTGKGKTKIGKLSIQPLETKSIDKLKDIIKILNQALPTTELSEKHDEILWKKLFINSVINPLTAIYQVNNGEILNNPQIKQQAIELTKQLQPIIQIHLTKDDWRKVWTEIELVVEQTSLNLSSMRQDLLNHKSTEIDYISGYLVQQAKLLNISLPEHERVIHLVKKLENNSLNSVTNASS